MEPPSLIAVDIGNTTTSIGFFQKKNDGFPSPINVIQYSNSETGFAEFRKNMIGGDHELFVASVCQIGLQRFFGSVKAAGLSEPHLLSNHELPMKISVDIPEKVGIDRLLGSLAAHRRSQENLPSIVIDAGSAITIDVISSKNDFLGGVIFPGIRMQTGALNQQTDQLPLIDANVASDPPSIIGKDTASAIRSGVFWGAIGSIREIVHKMQVEVGKSKIFLTGGDLEKIACFIPNAEFVPNLVLSGIAIAAQHIRSNASR